MDTEARMIFLIWFRYVLPISGLKIAVSQAERGLETLLVSGKVNVDLEM